MPTAMYRISSNEVLKISIQGQLFSDRDPAVFGVLTDPSLPDGNTVRDQSGAEPGPLRVLGFSKFAVVGTNTVRNSTEGEIDGYAASETADNNQLDADQAAGLADVHPQFRKTFKAVLKGIVRENNIMASRYNEIRAEMLAASSLGDLQTRITNDTQDAPIRTNQQAFDAVRPDVDPND